MMHRTLQELETEALELPVEARSELAAKLLESLEPSDTEIQKHWIREAERRAEEMRSGRVRGEPIGSVLTRIQAKLG
ncbi:MAG: addiction module protein [Acidobacteriota bacterium]